MVSKQQAEGLTHRAEVHYPLNTNHTKCVKMRVNGRCQTWKTRPDSFRLPLKVGFNGHAEITEVNAPTFFLPDECPVCAPKLEV